MLIEDIIIFLEAVCAGPGRENACRDRAHCKKRLLIFPSSTVNYSRPGRVWLVTSWLGMGKPQTFFYSAGAHKVLSKFVRFAFDPV